jgi:hypothetical protein
MIRRKKIVALDLSDESTWRGRVVKHRDVEDYPNPFMIHNVHYKRDRYYVYSSDQLDDFSTHNQDGASDDGGTNWDLILV